MAPDAHRERIDISEGWRPQWAPMVIMVRCRGDVKVVVSMLRQVPSKYLYKRMVRGRHGCKDV
jgi:hypothetical protein